MAEHDRRLFACTSADSCPDRGDADKLVKIERVAPSPQDSLAPSRPAGEWKRIGDMGDVQINGMKQVVVEGVSVLIANTGGGLVAFQSLCPHEAVPLERGALDGSTLTCLEHMWQFDIRSGAPLGEALEGLRSYALKDDQGDLYIAL